MNADVFRARIVAALKQVPLCLRHQFQYLAGDFERLPPPTEEQLAELFPGEEEWEVLVPSVLYRAIPIDELRREALFRELDNLVKDEIVDVASIEGLPRRIAEPIPLLHVSMDCENAVPYLAGLRSVRRHRPDTALAHRRLYFLREHRRAIEELIREHRRRLRYGASRQLDSALTNASLPRSKRARVPKNESLIHQLLRAAELLQQVPGSVLSYDVDVLLPVPPSISHGLFAMLSPPKWELDFTYVDMPIHKWLLVCDEPDNTVFARKLKDFWRPLGITILPHGVAYHASCALARVANRRPATQWQIIHAAARRFFAHVYEDGGVEHLIFG